MEMSKLVKRKSSTKSQKTVPKAMPSGRSQRRLRNLLLKPRAQIELVINILTITIFFGLASCLIIYFQLNDLFTNLYDASNISDYISEITTVNESANVADTHNTQTSQTLGEKQTSLLENWNMTIKWLLVFIIVYVITTVLICMVHSHRMIGPTIAFQRQLTQLLSGNYKARVKLRDGDYYQNIADLLNGLSEHLEKRLVKNVDPNDKAIHYINSKN
ncbi:MAG: hypothetical protein OXC44_07425 [Proteobacteria bacterium]|nr:hypothetical protein [Pseudomonadota bacterium]